MQQVISYFNETLNDAATTDENETTQLYEAIDEADVDSVRFLVQHEGILLDKLSRPTYEQDGVDQLYETPLNFAVRSVEEHDDNDWQTVQQNSLSTRIQIVELLREAGGNAREISREEWLAEQNELMETTPGE